MNRRKLARRVRRLERKVAEMEKARMWEPLEAVDVSGPELDVPALLNECVGRWMHGWDDDEDWSDRGYL